MHHSIFPASCMYFLSVQNVIFAGYSVSFGEQLFHYFKGRNFREQNFSWFLRFPGFLCPQKFSTFVICKSLFPQRFSKLVIRILQNLKTGCPYSFMPNYRGWGSNCKFWEKNPSSSFNHYKRMT